MRHSRDRRHKLTLAKKPSPFYAPFSIPVDFKRASQRDWQVTINLSDLTQILSYRPEWGAVGTTILLPVLMRRYAKPITLLFEVNRKDKTAVTHLYPCDNLPKVKHPARGWVIATQVQFLPPLQPQMRCGPA